MEKLRNSSGAVTTEKLKNKKRKTDSPYGVGFLVFFLNSPVRFRNCSEAETEKQPFLRDSSGSANS